MNSVRSPEEISQILARERAACDRHLHELSLVVFESACPELIRVLLHRVRKVDEVGRFNDHSICAILPYTPGAAAKKLAEDVSTRVPKPPRFRILTYGGSWLPTPGPQPEGETSLAGEPVLRLDDWRTNPMPVWKRAIDIATAGIGLVLLLPLLLVMAVMIKLVSPGPALLKQDRIGLNGQVFGLWKFRTMRPNADDGIHQEHLKTLIASDQPMTKLDVSEDQRIFPGGKIIRRCYLDELPQLINVLRGEMSLVGPRPCLPYEAAQYQSWHTGRFQVTPGMTGLWQVSGKNKTTFAEMIRLDIAYANRLSLGLDLKILLRTVPTILFEIVARLTDRKPRAGQALNVRAVRKNT